MQLITKANKKCLIYRRGLYMLKDSNEVIFKESDIISENQKWIQRHFKHFGKNKKKLPADNEPINITYEEVSSALSQIKRGKACAYDGIKDQLFSLNKIRQIAETEIRIVQAEMDINRLNN